MAMDDHTVLVFVLQLVALCGVAASLLVYLLFRIKGRHCPGRDGGLAVLLTSCDTAFGLEAALHLADEGYRVFAGVRDVECAAAHLLSALGVRVTVLPLDVTREDLLHEAVDIVRKHLPAGEGGLWAVVNTAGICCKGRLEAQEGTHWDIMLKYNVLGTLRTARTFLPLLKNNRGRLINIGAPLSPCERGTGLVAYTASRFAVEGASCVLRQEMAPHGVQIITLQPDSQSVEYMFNTPNIRLLEQVSQSASQTASHSVVELAPYESVLPPHVLRTLDDALLAKTNRNAYPMVPQSRCTILSDALHRVMYPQSDKPQVAT